MARKVLLDVNIYDTFKTNSELRGLFDRAKDLKLIDPVITHVTLDQINRMPESKVSLQSSILSVINAFSTTSTSGHVNGISRDGWSNPAPQEALEKIIGEQTLTVGNLEDALQGATALNQDFLFVTNDHRLWNRCNALKIGSAMKESEFQLFLQELINFHH